MKDHCKVSYVHQHVQQTNRHKLLRWITGSFQPTDGKAIFVEVLKTTQNQNNDVIPRTSKLYFTEMRGFLFSFPSATKKSPATLWITWRLPYQQQSAAAPDVSPEISDPLYHSPHPMSRPSTNTWDSYVHRGPRPPKNKNKYDCTIDQELVGAAEYVLGRQCVCAFTRRQHSCAWNDVMVAILKVRRNRPIFTCSRK